MNRPAGAGVRSASDPPSSKNSAHVRDRPRGRHQRPLGGGPPGVRAAHEKPLVHARSGRGERGRGSDRSSSWAPEGPAPFQAGDETTRFCPDAEVVRLDVLSSPTLVIARRPLEQPKDVLRRSEIRPARPTRAGRSGPIWATALEARALSPARRPGRGDYLEIRSPKRPDSREGVPGAANRGRRERAPGSTSGCGLRRLRRSRLIRSSGQPEARNRRGAES